MNWFRAVLVTVAAAIGGACSSTSVDLAAWRAEQAAVRGAITLATLEADLQRVEELRAADELAPARALALALADAHPTSAQVLTHASRAESDAVFVFATDDKPARNAAALSALDYATRAAELGASDAASRAQLAWALGTTTHLQPMFDRSDHAHRTLETARAALELDAAEPTALATLALVHLRLETLPWIASVMAVGRPDSSLEDAERFARAACEARPSREHRLILAKVLVAAERETDAREQLQLALSTRAVFARDAALLESVQTLARELEP